MQLEQTITIRQANTSDSEALRRLAERDSSSLSEAAYLLAETGGTPLAAIGLSAGSVIADPFEPTAHLVSLLRETAASERAARSPQLLRRGGLATGTA